MSGLTLGLMSLGLVELEILQRSGTDSEKAQAGPIRIPNLPSPPFPLLCSIYLRCYECCF
jgi:hypothetical protein